MTLRPQLLILVLLASTPASAHPGRTAADGCHAGERHRHCHEPKPTAPQPPVLEGVVQKVVDGDTLKVRLASGELRVVRLKGIDCPESRRNPKCVRDGDCEADREPGKRATERVRGLVQGKPVRLVAAGPKFERDRYGRTLAYVELLVGTDLGLDLVRSGYCVDYSHRYPHPRSADYLKAQAASSRAGTARGQ